jgi:hypothetical protein
VNAHEFAALIHKPDAQAPAWRPTDAEFDQLFWSPEALACLREHATKVHRVNIARLDRLVDRLIAVKPVPPTKPVTVELMDAETARRVIQRLY